MVHGGGRGHVINLDYASPLLLLRPKKKKSEPVRVTVRSVDRGETIRFYQIVWSGWLT